MTVKAMSVIFDCIVVVMVIGVNQAYLIHEHGSPLHKRRFQSISPHFHNYRPRKLINPYHDHEHHLRGESEKKLVDYYRAIKIKQDRKLKHERELRKKKEDKKRRELKAKQEQLLKKQQEEEKKKIERDSNYLSYSLNESIQNFADSIEQLQQNIQPVKKHKTVKIVKKRKKKRKLGVTNMVGNAKDKVKDKLSQYWESGNLILGAGGVALAGATIMNTIKGRKLIKEYNKLSDNLAYTKLADKTMADLLSKFNTCYGNLKNSLERLKTRDRQLSFSLEARIADLSSVEHKFILPDEKN